MINLIKIFFISVLLCTTMSVSADLPGVIVLKEGEKLQDIIPQRGSQFVKLLWNEPSAEKIINIGSLLQMKRFTASFRNKSCWMIPCVGSQLSELPIETQFFLGEMEDGKYLMIIPIIDKLFRSSIQGDDANSMNVVVESGDRFTQTTSSVALYLIRGDNPYGMIHMASKEIADFLKTFTLRENKQLPWFTDHLGWCSWNAFYQNVSHENTKNILENMKVKKIPVKWLLIDDGMQRTNDRRLISYEADTVKFPYGLKGLTEMAKNQYGIEKVIVWQTLWGSWMGLDPNVFSGKTRLVNFSVPPRYQSMLKNANGEDITKEGTVGKSYYPGKFIGTNFLIPGPDFGSFYFDYYDFLRKQGVDGVKIDAMTWVETLGDYGGGGRITMMKDMMDGVQKASMVHFNNEYVNCSSCSNDYLYNTLTANVTRTSGDFFPNKPETHGFHIYVNAHTSFWMGDIITPDWDMFQSGHESGAFHAAARAISGGPVYSTEEYGTEDPLVLNALCTSKGRILRCIEPGRVTRASLFTDPLKGKDAINVFNSNRYNYVVGTFNCSYSKDKVINVTSLVSPSDVEGIVGGEFAAYDWNEKKLEKVKTETKITRKLSPLQFNIYTFAPIDEGFAVIGLENKYNPGGAVLSMKKVSTDIRVLELLDGGRLICYTQRRPSKILMGNEKLNFSYLNNMLLIDVPATSDSISVSIFL